MRNRDHGEPSAVQLSMEAHEEEQWIHDVMTFLKRENQWRPLVKMGNFQTQLEAIYRGEELASRTQPTDGDA